MFLTTMGVLAVGVRPLVIDLNLRPGETRNFEVTLTPGVEEETVDLAFYQPVQLLNGSLAYQQPDYEAFSAISWVKLSSHQVKVYPGEETRVTGTVTVPFSAAGSHTAIIMVEPQAPDIQQGISFKVRYAVRLNIRVDKPGLRQTAELVELEMVPGEAGQPVIQTVIHNSSVWDFLVSGEVTIRDKDKRLVENVVLTSPSSAGSGSNTLRMYPGSQVEFIGEVTKRLTPGEYTLRAFFRFGDYGQIIKSKTITIAQGDYNFPTADEIGAFTVDPHDISIKARAGEQKSQVLQLISEIGDTATISFKAEPISAEYPYSLVDWINFRSMSDTFELPGRRNARLAFTIAIPRDTEDASYHGKVVLSAYSTAGELLSEKLIPVSVLVGSEHIHAAEVRSLVGVVVEDVETALSLDILNAGTAPLTPQANIIIADAEGNYVERAILSLPEGIETVIPLQSQRLEGTTVDLEPGIYQITITINNAGQAVTVVEQLLEIL